MARYRKTGQLQRRQRRVSGFKTKYTEKDIRLLVALDTRLGVLSWFIVYA